MTHSGGRPDALPGDKLDASKMPGHWLLARMGKRVLRPGGIEMTRRMLDSLSISSSDTVVELAPGMGATARLTLAFRPAAYIAVERVPNAAMHLLEPWRVISDEGIFGAARIAMNVMRTPVARHRILAMRGVFKRYAKHLCAVSMTGHKPL
ncbi:hypothetical protein Mal15_18290 [Stieleria maiorica]|uniref:SAM-dependent methyltransferase n=1 Tax=Stieleria maiorica TaxID=2795974 RepID=A0A5B9ME63_9BACT|nr:hypothetical protein Mal15_18290 [Stieleria maiorica]